MTKDVLLLELLEIEVEAIAVNAPAVPLMAFAATLPLLKNDSIPKPTRLLGHVTGRESSMTVPSISPLSPPWLDGIVTFFIYAYSPSNSEG